eukprot:COSAG04_NODE_27283_length_284_cov_1.989189_1_plen_76_part_10
MAVEYKVEVPEAAASAAVKQAATAAVPNSATLTIPAAATASGTVLVSTGVAVESFRVFAWVADTPACPQCSNECGT